MVGMLLWNQPFWNHRNFFRFHTFIKRFMRYVIIPVAVLVISCNNHNSAKEKSSKTDTIQIGDTVAEIIDIPMPSPHYDFEKHDDINVFMSDLAAAFVSSDSTTISGMMHFPFKDDWIRFITAGNTPLKKGTPDLNCIDSVDFLTKYRIIFAKQIATPVRNKVFRGHDKNSNGEAMDLIEEGEYVIEGEYDGVRAYGLAIKKFNGKYKIYRTAFSS